MDATTTLQPVSANVIAVLAAAGEPRPPLSAAWRREIAQRLADFDAGRVQAIPWSEVRARWAARSAARG